MLKINELAAKWSRTTPDLDLLLAFAIGKSKEFLFVHPEYRLSFFEYSRLAYYAWLRRNNWPLAYITHRKEFFGIDFYVNKHTLIPRPDTEILVLETIQEIKKTENQEVNLIDVGTGSGCIPVAILKTLKYSEPKQNTKVIAIDISRRALAVAKKNARIQNVSIDFLHGDLLQPILVNQKILSAGGRLLVTANLPYLTDNQLKTEPSIQKEPYTALVAAEQGLALYRKLFGQIKSLALRFDTTLFIEIDPSQTAAVSNLIDSTLPGATYKIKKDLSGKNRLVIIECR